MPRYTLGTPEEETALALQNGERLPGWKELNVRTVFDVGASVGEYAGNALQAFPEATIHAIEPNPAAFPLLEKWVAEHGQGRVKVYSAALANKNATGVFTFVHGEPSTSSLLRPTRWLYARAPQVAAQTLLPMLTYTLDSFVAAYKIVLQDDVGIKLDVQGAEHAVLEGADQTLHRTRFVYTEIMLDRLYENQATFLDILQLLDGYGFRYAGNMSQTANPWTGAIMWVDALFIK